MNNNIKVLYSLCIRLLRSMLKSFRQVSGNLLNMFSMQVIDTLYIELSISLNYESCV